MRDNIKQIQQEVLGRTVISIPEDVNAELISALREIFFETQALLKQHPLESNQIYWLWNLASLAKQLLVVKKLLPLESPLQRSIHEPLVNSIVEVNLMKRDLVEFNQWFLTGYDKSLKAEDICEWVFLVLQLVSTDSEEFCTIEDLPLLYIKRIGFFLASLGADLNSIFGALVEYIKVCYLADLGEEVVPFIAKGYIYPLAPLDVQDLDYNTLIDFYRYTAFVLVSPKLRGPPPFSAAEYFNALLLIPSLASHLVLGDVGAHKDDSDETKSARAGLQNQALHVFTPDSVLEKNTGSIEKPTKYILLKERQEIALLYIVDYLLSLSSLSQLVSPPTLFKHEHVIVMSIMNTIRQDMLRSVNVSSRLLVVLLTTLSAGSNETTLSSRCISSILYHGTYNEVFTMIVKFLKNLHNIRGVMNAYLDQGTESSYVERIGSSINAQLSPGKLQYVKIVNRISHLIEFLTLKQWVASTGTINVSPSMIELVVGISKDRLVANPYIKSQVRSKNNLEVVNFDFSSTARTIEMDLQEQMAIVELTRRMQMS